MKVLIPKTHRGVNILRAVGSMLRAMTSSRSTPARKRETAYVARDLRDQAGVVRITTQKRRKTWVVRVSGRLARGDIAALAEACAAGRGGLCLDFSELTGLDDTSVEAVRALIARGAQVAGASPYISLRLGQEPSEHAATKKRRE
jgi:hypothetical protein